MTAADFRRFVRDTGYVTVAERPLDPARLSRRRPGALVPGSLVFRKTRGPVSLDDFRNWWAYVPGAPWKRPGGPGTTINGRDQHPVVQVAYEDAETYATWAGKELPSEAQWEYAARGGLDGAVFAWGDAELPEGRPLANTWQGEFPWQNLKLDGFEGTAPVGSFPPNGYGLFDMTGNTWEWTIGLVHAEASRRGAEPVLRPAQPTGRLIRRELRGRTAGLEHSAEGDQGRLASVRSQLLPALPTGGTPGRDDRHVHGPHRLPLRSPASLIASRRISRRRAFRSAAREGVQIASRRAAAWRGGASTAPRPLAVRAVPR